MASDLLSIYGQDNSFCIMFDPHTNLLPVVEYIVLKS